MPLVNDVILKSPDVFVVEVKPAPTLILNFLWYFATMIPLPPLPAYL